MTPLRTEWYASTDVGAVRELNEDRWFASDTLGLWAVADGMGGMARGDWAAQQVADALAATPDHDTLPEMIAAVAASLHNANAAILDEASARGEQMGSTAVALVVRGDAFGLVWIGDSRAYLLRDRRLHRLTRDHSQVQEMVDRGLIAADEAETHPLKNVLTRAVGVASPLQLDSITDRLRPDDVLLLCSDGLYGPLGDERLEAILAREPAGRAGDVLIRACHERGAPDNVTLISIVAAEATMLQLGEAMRA